jgi:hypothetical protein
MHIGGLRHAGVPITRGRRCVPYYPASVPSLSSSAAYVPSLSPPLLPTCSLFPPLLLTCPLSFLSCLRALSLSSPAYVPSLLLSCLRVSFSSPLYGHPSFKPQTSNLKIRACWVHQAEKRRERAGPAPGRGKGSTAKPLQLRALSEPRVKGCLLSRAFFWWGGQRNTATNRQAGQRESTSKSLTPVFDFARRPLHMLARFIGHVRPNASILSARD